MNLGKTQRQVAADETIQICEKGWYLNASHEKVFLNVDSAVRGSVLYESLSFDISEQDATSIMEVKVSRESSLQCAWRLLGGGFKGGNLAQEESLALCSALHSCLANFHASFYAPHRTDDNRGLYTNKVIYSPEVPVFREDENLGLLLAPFEVCFVTVAAPHAKNARSAGVSQAEIDQVMSDRIELALSCMASHRHSTLVLGAFGCGVFGNDSDYVSSVFAEKLRTRAAKAGFRCVVFAILEKHIEGQFQSFVEGLQPKGDEWKLVIEENPLPRPHEYVKAAAVSEDIATSTDMKVTSVGDNKEGAVIIRSRRCVLL